jgi:hypothetical protein
MPRTDEAEAFFHAVCRAVQEIPPGKVTSYGHIAKLVGTRKKTPFPSARCRCPFPLPQSRLCPSISQFTIGQEWNPAMFFVPSPKPRRKG